MNKVIVIVGPTAVGKTKLSVILAKMFSGEVINADSTQVYRGLDIATAKIKEDEKEGIPHHLFDICDILEDYTVYDYQKDCRTKISEIESRGHIPILVGGTGLYIKAALYDYQFFDETKRLDYSNEELYQKMLQIDSSASIHPNNRQRIERALDYYYNHGVIKDSNNTDSVLYDFICIGLSTSRDVLYNRIDYRVDQMIESGLLEESKRLYDSKICSKAVLTPIGYKELFLYFKGEASLEDCISKMKQNSRRYAKRQYTWFRHQMDVAWFDVDFENFDATASQVIDYIRKNLKEQ